ncbi:hypothetical protein [Enterococcus faecium]|uniref:hypothetical protein n=1 Tax=Enterococcus faecium TaxID=1352 RepID=UPI002892E6D4|nr:hypothetical protein [Enterococcus faecium]
MSSLILQSAKLRKHELTAAKAKLKKEYGASAEETYKVAKNCIANIITLQTFCLKTEIVNEEQKETRYYSIN